MSWRGAVTVALSSAVGGIPIVALLSHPVMQLPSVLVTMVCSFLSASVHFVSVDRKSFSNTIGFMSFAALLLSHLLRVSCEYFIWYTISRSFLLTSPTFWVVVFSTWALYPLYGPQIVDAVFDSFRISGCTPVALCLLWPVLSHRSMAHAPACWLISVAGGS